MASGSNLTNSHLRLTKIYSLNTVLGEWMVETKPITFNHDSLANPIKNYIVDLESGAELTASPEAFKQAMGTGANGANSVWIAISKRSIRSQVNFSGEKLAKVDLIESDEVQQAVILTKNGGSRVYLLELCLLSLQV